MEGGCGMFNSSVYDNVTLLVVLARGLLKSLLIKQNIKYDDPEPAKKIFRHSLNSMGSR